MASKFYGGRRCAIEIRAAEVPVDYATKARKADREFNGAGYVRNGPPGPVLTFLRSMPPTIGQCCHWQDQARVMIANLNSRAFSRVSLRGVARRSKQYDSIRFSIF